MGILYAIGYICLLVSYCNKKVDPERYVSFGSYEPLVSNVAHQINVKFCWNLKFIHFRPAQNNKKKQLLREIVSCIFPELANWPIQYGKVWENSQQLSWIRHLKAQVSETLMYVFWTSVFWHIFDPMNRTCKQQYHNWSDSVNETLVIFCWTEFFCRRYSVNSKKIQFFTHGQEKKYCYT